MNSDRTKKKKKLVKLHIIIQFFLPNQISTIFFLLQNNHCYPTYFDETLTDSQANGFDADSEGSDYEIVPNEKCKISDTDMNNGIIK